MTPSTAPPLYASREGSPCLWLPPRYEVERLMCAAYRFPTVAHRVTEIAPHTVRIERFPTRSYIRFYLVPGGRGIARISRQVVPVAVERNKLAVGKFGIGVMRVIVLAIVGIKCLKGDATH